MTNNYLRSLHHRYTVQLSQWLYSVVTNPMYLAVLFFITGLGALLALRLLIVNAYTTLYPLSLVVASLVSIVVLHRLKPGTIRLSEFEIPEVSAKTILILYLLLTTFCTLLFHNAGFQRGTSVYLLTLSLYGLSLFAIFSLREWIIPMLLVISTGIFHRATVYFTSPYAFGVDPHGHYRSAIDIALVGSLDPLSTSKYYFAPFYHIHGAIGSLVLDTPVEGGVMFAVMIVPIVIVATLVIFSLLYHYWGWQIALLASVLFLSSDHAIGGMLSLGPTELSFLFFTLGVYSAVCYLLRGERQWLLILLFIFGALTFTHQGSTFTTVLVVSGFALLFAVVTRKYSRSIVLVFILGITMLVDWTATTSGGPDGGSDFFTGLLGNTLRSLITQLRATSEGTGGRPEGALPPDADITPTGMFASMTEIHVLGGAILFGFGIIGILWWLYSVRGTDYQWLSFTLGGSTILLLGMMMGGPLIGFSFFVPGRWFMHVYLLLSIFAAIGLVVSIKMVSVNISHSNIITVLLIFAICLLFVSVMGGNAYGSVDGPVFDSAPGAERLSFTDSEATKVQHLEQHHGERAELYSDRRIQPIVSRYSESSIDSSILRVDYESGELRYWAWADERHNYIYIREMMITRSIYDIYHNEQYFRIYGPMPVSEQSLLDFNLIYQSEDSDCNAVHCGIYSERDNI